MFSLSVPTSRRLLRGVVLASTIAVAGRQIVGLLQMSSTVAWLDTGAAPGGGQPEPDPAETPVHFVVPVLHEQDHVVDAMAWFEGLLDQLPGSTLTIVTSDREDAERALPERTGGRSPAAKPTTSDIVAAELATGRAHPRTRHAHYTGPGRKAAQVNHAVAELGRSGYVAVYDVDSRPSPDLVCRTLRVAQAHRRRTGQYPPVIQQSSRFVAPDTHPAAWQRFVCRGAATLQTLWTLRRELPSFRAYHARADHMQLVGTGGRAGLVRGRLAQTVGHGLFVRTDVFADVAGLPTYTVLDDLPFGYRLTVLGVDVVPVPVLTQVPACGDVAELLAQGGRWFENYLDYPRCAQQARHDGAGTGRARLVALAVGGYRGLTWLLRSPGAAVVLLACSPRAGTATRVSAAAALLAGFVAPVRLLARTGGDVVSWRRSLLSSAELLAATLLSSVGPAIAVIRRLRAGPPDAAVSPRTRTRSRPDLQRGTP